MTDALANGNHIAKSMNHNSSIKPLWQLHIIGPLMQVSVLSTAQRDCSNLSQLRYQLAAASTEPDIFTPEIVPRNSPSSMGHIVFVITVASCSLLLLVACTLSPLNR